MTAGLGGMGVQGQAVDANGMVRRVAYGNVPPQQQYVMANGEQVPPGAHRGQGQQVGMVQGQGQYMTGMMPPQGQGQQGQGQGNSLTNGMMGGPMTQMGGRTGDLDNGMFQVNPRGDQTMGGRPIDIRDRVDVRNGKQQQVRSLFFHDDLSNITSIVVNCQLISHNSFVLLYRRSVMLTME